MEILTDSKSINANLGVNTYEDKIKNKNNWYK